MQKVAIQNTRIQSTTLLGIASIFIPAELIPVRPTVLTKSPGSTGVFKDTFTFLRGKKKTLATATQANSLRTQNWDPEFRFGSTGRAPRVYGLNRGSGLRTRTTLLGYDIRTVFLFHLLLCSSSE